MCKVHYKGLNYHNVLTRNKAQTKIKNNGLLKVIGDFEALEATDPTLLVKTMFNTIYFLKMF